VKVQKRKGEVAAQRTTNSPNWANDENLEERKKKAGVGRKRVSTPTKRKEGDQAGPLVSPDERYSRGIPQNATNIKPMPARPVQTAKYPTGIDRKNSDSDAKADGTVKGSWP